MSDVTPRTRPASRVFTFDELEVGQRYRVPYGRIFTVIDVRRQPLGLPIYLVRFDGDGVCTTTLSSRDYRHDRFIFAHEHLPDAETADNSLTMEQAQLERMQVGQRYVDKSGNPFTLIEKLSPERMLVRYAGFQIETRLRFIGPVTPADDDPAQAAGQSFIPPTPASQPHPAQRHTFTIPRSEQIVTLTLMGSGGSRLPGVAAQPRLAQPRLDQHDGQYDWSDFDSRYAPRRGEKLAWLIMDWAPYAAMITIVVAVSVLFAYAALAASGAAR